MKECIHTFIVTNTSSNGSCNYAVMEISETLKEEILSRRKLFLAMKAQDIDLHEMYFWDCTPEFYSYNLADIGDNYEWAKIVAKDDFALVDRDVGEGHVGKCGQRIECQQLIIRENDFCWEAKHELVHVRTANIKYETLGKKP